MVCTVLHENTANNTIKNIITESVQHISAKEIEVVQHDRYTG